MDVARGGGISAESVAAATVSLSTLPSATDRNVRKVTRMLAPSGMGVHLLISLAARCHGVNIERLAVTSEGGRQLVLHVPLHLDGQDPSNLDHRRSPSIPAARCWRQVLLRAMQLFPQALPLVHTLQQACWMGTMIGDSAGRLIGGARPSAMARASVFTEAPMFHPLGGASGQPASNHTLSRTTIQFRAAQLRGP